MLILVCNAGSTSLKYKLLDMPAGNVFAEGREERVGSENSTYLFRIGERVLSGTIPILTYRDGIELFLKELDCIDTINAVGFKTVLSRNYRGVHLITEEVIGSMEEWNSVAPAHNPPYIEAIRVFQKLLPSVPLVGVFETAFHQTIPEYARVYPGKYEWYSEYGFQKLGYHGASHSYIAQYVEEDLGTNEYRLISCHLGGSGSICAIKDGKSLESSFGFSLQTGLPHSGRSGDIDPYVVPFLMQNAGLTADEVYQSLGKESGLKGLSGVSGDLRDIEEAALAGNKRAALAIDVYCYSIIKYIGSWYAVLGGLDYITFTGGIGEHSALVRDKVLERVAHLGIRLDEQKNRENATVISTPDSPVKVMVIPADEELVVARKSYNLLEKEQNI